MVASENAGPVCLSAFRDGLKLGCTPDSLRSTQAAGVEKRKYLGPLQFARSKPTTHPSACTAETPTTHKILFSGPMSVLAYKTASTKPGGGLMFKILAEDLWSDEVWRNSDHRRGTVCE
jgi:hypothetical protein